MNKNVITRVIIANNIKQTSKKLSVSFIILSFALKRIEFVNKLTKKFSDRSSAPNCMLKEKWVWKKYYKTNRIYKNQFNVGYTHVHFILKSMLG